MLKIPKSLQGHLLLDSGRLQGSFFHRSVVLICKHDEEGAFGLILNRSSGSKVGDAIVADLPDVIKAQEVFIGGPVQAAALSYLHSDTFLSETNVMLNLDLGHSLDELVEVGESYSGEQKLKLFAGYSGWDAGQLEKELARKDWLIHPASLDLVFCAEPASLWQGIVRQIGDQGRLLAGSPDDLSWN